MLFSSSVQKAIPIVRMCHLSNVHSLNLERRTRVRFVVYCAHYARTRKGFSFESMLVLHKFKLKKPKLLTVSLPFCAEKLILNSTLSACHHTWCIAGPVGEMKKWMKTLFESIVLHSSLPPQGRNATGAAGDQKTCPWVSLFEM